MQGPAIKTYSRSRSRTTSSIHDMGPIRTNSLRDLTNRAPTSPPATPKRKRERKVAVDDEHGGTENNAAVPSTTRMGRSTSLNSMSSLSAYASSTTSLSTSSQRHSKAKRYNSFADLVKTGHEDDMRMLSERIQDADSKKGIDNQSMARIYDDGTVKPDRFNRWLSALGFEAKVWGDTVIYVIPMEKMKEIKRILIGTEHWQLATGPSIAGPATAPSNTDVRSRMTPSCIITDPAALSRMTPDGFSARAPTPSRFLAEVFAGMTFRSGDTPTAAGTPFSVVSPSDPVHTRQEPGIGEGTSRPPSGLGLPSTFVSRHDSTDDHDAEVRDIMIRNSESCCSAPGDVSSSRSLSVLPSPPLKDRSSPCLSVPNVPLDAIGVNGSSAFKSKDSKSRRLTRNRRSVSEPPASSFIPSSPVSFSRTQPIDFATPTKYPYASTEGAMTQLLAKCADTLHTVERSEEAHSPRVVSSGVFPTLDMNGADEGVGGGNVYSNEPPVLDRRNVLSLPARLSDGPHSLPSEETLLGSFRQTLRSRTKDLTRVNSVSVKDGSPIVSCSENIYAIPESGEESGIDESVMMRAVSNDLCSTLKKEKLSKSKRHRLSSGGRNLCRNSGRKHLSTRRRGRRSSFFSLKNSSRAPLMPESPVEKEGYLPPIISESNFFPVTVGGIYQQGFEFNRPIIYEAGSLFPYVLAIELGNIKKESASGLSLQSKLSNWYIYARRNPVYSVFSSHNDVIDIIIHTPGNDRYQRSISLGYDWCIVPAYPSGLLVVCTKYFVRCDKRRLSFFIPDHVLRREVGYDISSKVPEASNGIEELSAPGMDMDLNTSQMTEATEIDYMECIELNFPALDSSMLSDGSNTTGTDDRYRDFHSSHHHLMAHLETGAVDSPFQSSICGDVQSPPLGEGRTVYDDSGLRVNMDSQRTSEGLTSGLLSEGSAYFNNILYDKTSLFSDCLRHNLVGSDDILGLVLPFLEDNNECAGLVAGAENKTKRRGHRGPTGFDAVKLVCKRWAVSWIRYTSSLWSLRKWNLRSDSVLSELYSSWVNCVKKYRSGSAVGSGGAKKVFRVERSGSGRLIKRASSVADAVAVMDVEYVLDHAVEQELVVSVAVSSLVTTNICPNVVQIHSTFQSPFPAPRMWQSISMSYDIPKAESMKLGHYQYICMEYCSGGDVEGYIRRKRTKKLPSDDIRNIFFQMCFSLYSCRDQLNLRHLDIKLLNFLLCDPSVLLKGEASVPSRYEISYRVGFGENVYKLNLASSGPGLVKLADFGTSLIGQDMHQSSITAKHVSRFKYCYFKYTSFL